MEPSTLAEIYKYVSIDGRYWSFRFRDVITLDDYLSVDSMSWKWVSHQPTKIIAVYLDNFCDVELGFYCNVRRYVLLSSLEEIKKIRKMNKCQILDILKKSYGAIHPNIIGAGPKFRAIDKFFTIGY